jgi:hypothetical protein
MLYRFYKQNYLPDLQKIAASYPAVFTTGNILVYRFTKEEFSLKTFPGTIPRIYDLQQ